jgi:hypothetical protein
LSIKTLSVESTGDIPAMKSAGKTRTDHDDIPSDALAADMPKSPISVAAKAEEES